MTEDQRQAWAAVLESGDTDAIEEMKDELLAEIHTRIMNDDAAVYIQGGWTPTNSRAVA